MKGYFVKSGYNVLNSIRHRSLMTKRIEGNKRIEGWLLRMNAVAFVSKGRIRLNYKHGKGIIPCLEKNYRP